MVWILDADADEEQGTESIEKITSLVVDAGGEVAGTEAWGKRVLAYPIKKNSEGYYLQANFEIDGPQAQNFESAIYADQSIIRHLLVRAENPVAIVEEEPESEKVASPECSSNTFIGQKQADGSWKTVCKE